MDKQHKAKITEENSKGDLKRYCQKTWWLDTINNDTNISLQEHNQLLTDSAGEIKLIGL